MERRYYLCTTHDSQYNASQVFIPITRQNPYDKYMYNKSHWIWAQKCSVTDYMIVTVLKKPFQKSDNVYCYTGVIINAREQIKFEINVNEPGIESVLSTFANRSQMTLIRNRLFNEVIPTIELYHNAVVKAMCIGVILVNPGQNKREEWFNNMPSHKFFSFINKLGSAIDLNTWSGYTGISRQASTLIYKHWRGVTPVIYHIAPILTKDEHRSLIGNEILIIMYLEPDHDFDLELLNQLGNMPQCFALVSKHKDKYRVKFAVKHEIPDLEPYACKRSVNFELLQDLILSKFYNVMLHVQRDGIFNRMYTLPRQNYINQIVNVALDEESKPKRSRSLPHFRRHKSGRARSNSVCI